MEPFVTAEELAGYPGAPFTAPAVEAVVERVREECGWHVAPEVREVLHLDGDGGFEQWMPTRRVSAVHSVKVWNGTEYVPFEAWDPTTGWSSSGILSARRPFPVGRRVLEVELTHGFPVGAALKTLVATATQRRVTAESIGARAVTYADDNVFGSASSALDTYRLGPRP